MFLIYFILLFGLNLSNLESNFFPLKKEQNGFIKALLSGKLKIKLSRKIYLGLWK